MTSMGIKVHERQSYPWEEVERSEVLKAIRQLKVGKAPSIDGITTEMLKYEEIVEWMLYICNVTWKQGKVAK